MFQSLSFSFRFVVDRDASESSFAVVMSKKIASKAVKRNFLRRRMYSALREIRDSQNNKYLGIFFMKQDALNLKYSDLKKEIILMLNKTKN